VRGGIEEGWIGDDEIGSLTEPARQPVGHVMGVHVAGSAGEHEVAFGDGRDVGVELDELDASRATEVVERERDRADTGAEIDAQRRAPCTSEVRQQERVDIESIPARWLLEGELAFVERVARGRQGHLADGARARRRLPGHSGRGRTKGHCPRLFRPKVTC
jgi:hypothetical protein